MKMTCCGFLSGFLLVSALAGGQATNHNLTGPAASNAPTAGGPVYLFCWGPKQNADGTLTVYVTRVVAWGPSPDPSHDSAAAFNSYMAKNYPGAGGSCPAGPTKAAAEQGRDSYMSRWTSATSKNMGTKVVEVDWKPGAPL
jgi:hypothetical protein